MTDRLATLAGPVKTLFATTNERPDMPADMATEKPGNPWGNRIRMAREKAGMSARKLSLAAGLAPGHVSTIERGEVSTINATTIYALAAVLQVPPAWLGGGDDDRPPWAIDGDRPAPPDTAGEERYPNRRVALALIGNSMDPEVKNALLSMRLDSDRDLSFAEWVTQAKMLADIRKGILKVHETDEDDAPRPKK